MPQPGQAADLQSLHITLHCLRLGCRVCRVETIVEPGAFSHVSDPPTRLTYLLTYLLSHTHTDTDTDTNTKTHTHTHTRGRDTHTHRQRQRQRQRHTNTHTHRDRDRDRDTHTHTNTHTHTHTKTDGDTDCCGKQAIGDATNTSDSKTFVCQPGRMLFRSIGIERQGSRCGWRLGLWSKP